MFDREETLENYSHFFPHRLTFFAILIITKGEVNHQVDFEICSLKTGKFLIISKGQVHAFDANSTYHGYLVLFTDSFLQKYIASSNLVKMQWLYNYFIGQNVFDNLVDDVQSFLDNALREIDINQALTPNIIGSFLTIFLLKITLQKDLEQPNQEAAKNYQYFNDFLQIVETKYTKTRDAKAYAQDLFISYKHLNNICKTVANQTAKRFIDNYIILEIKRKLAVTSLSISEICYECGFDEPTNFLKYFKKHTSQTPLEFRKSLQQTPNFN